MLYISVRGDKAIYHGTDQWQAKVEARRKGAEVLYKCALEVTDGIPMLRIKGKWDFTIGATFTSPPTTI